MQKITLQLGEVVDINGAIIGMEIVDTLLDLQFGIDRPGMPARENNVGIEESQGSYRRTVLFLSSEADYINDKDGLCSELTGLITLMDQWNRFRIPGTEKVKPW